MKFAHQTCKSLAMLFLLLVFNVPVFATIVVRMDLPHLVRLSDRIVQGRVDHVESRWEANSAYTYTYITVEDPIKGTRESVAVVREPGGVIGALHVDVAGMPQFIKGEEVILFLKSGRNGTFQVLGLNQGKYQIKDNVAVANVAGVDVYNPASGRLEAPALINRIPTERLKARIRELLK